jgi:hypothetical protein
MEILMASRQPKMIRIEFSPKEIDTLNKERYHYPHPMVQKRMEALFLKSQGYKHKDICRICCICKTSLAKYLKDYQSGGLKALKPLNFKGQSRELNSHATSLEERVFSGTSTFECGRSSGNS